MECEFALFKEKSVTKYSEEQVPVQQRDLELREAFIKGSGHTPPPPPDNRKDLTRKSKAFY